VLAGIGVLAAILFAVGNRAPATLSLWPLPVVVSLPLFILVLLTAMTGTVLGGVGSWLAAAPRRRKLRAMQRRVAVLEAELADAEARAETAPSSDHATHSPPAPKRLARAS
jgi:uncharacterized integral membrane protein